MCRYKVLCGRCVGMKVVCGRCVGMKVVCGRQVGKQCECRVPISMVGKFWIKDRSTV